MAEPTACVTVLHGTEVLGRVVEVPCVALAAPGRRVCAVHHRRPQLSPEPLGPDEEFVGYPSLCDTCHGDGHCDVCHGTGEHECRDLECGAVHECGACGGTGECEECKGEETRMWRKTTEAA